MKTAHGKTICKLVTFGPLSPTQFAELAYQHQGDGWRLASAEGHHIHTTRHEIESETLGFARQYGCQG